MNFEALFYGQVVHNGVPHAACCGYVCEEHGSRGILCNCPCDCADEHAAEESRVYAGEE